MTDPIRPLLYYDPEDLGPRAMAFVMALEALCTMHRIQISTSGYDGIDLRDLKPGEQPIHCAGIDDLTAAKEQR